jgi:hypothetical protein
MKIGSFQLDEKVRGQCNELVLGSIGFGKSKFLEHQMREDLKARQPFILIALHSSLYQDMKKWCAYSAYYDRNIILIDPSNGIYVKGFNPFRKKEGIQVSVKVAGMVDSIMSVWGDQNLNATPVIFKLLTVLFTVMIEFEIPLHIAFELLNDRKGLTKKVECLKNSTIEALWSSILKLSSYEWDRQLAPTLARLFRIVRSETIQRFMCIQDEVYNLDFTFNDTILINLGTSGNLDSDAQKTFAALLLNDLYQSAKRRTRKDGKDPRPYYVYVDEWWLVPTPDFHRILAETRKFGLLLVLANQDLAQIRDSFSSGFTESLLTLCQIQFCFGGLNDNDASRLAREWGVPAEQVKWITERKCFAKAPRQSVSILNVPEVKSPFVADSEIENFERRIAEKTNSLTLEQVDEKLKTSHNKPKPTQEDLDPYER